VYILIHTIIEGDVHSENLFNNWGVAIIGGSCRFSDELNLRKVLIYMLFDSQKVFIKSTLFIICEFNKALIYFKI